MTMMRKLLPFAALVSVAVTAAGDNPWYVGGRIGYTDFSSFDQGLTKAAFDDEDWGGGLFFGYDFNPWVSLETGYTYLGTADSRLTSDDGFEVQALDLVGKLSWPVQQNMDLFVKAGGYYYDADNDVFGDDDSDISVTAGVGLEYDFTKQWSTRLEYQYYDDAGTRKTGNSNIHFYGVSFVFSWGAPVAPVIAPEPEPEPKPAPLVMETIVIEEVAAILPFEFDSNDLTQEDVDALQVVGKQLVKYPDTKLYVVGHTDSRGTEEYNQTLSEERAASVVNYVMQYFNIPRDRILVEGRGELEPIATNDTEEGRAMNRRVEVFVPEFKVEKAM